MKKYLTEFIGTLFLVLIIGLTQNPLAIGFGLTVLVYMGAHISGAHYNPAVSLAIISGVDFFRYIIAQIFGAALGAYLVFTLSSNMTIQPNLDESVYQILLAEVLFTYLLVLVILNVACHPNLKDNSFYGLAIGLTVMAGAYSVGGLSGGVFNPAVSIGPSIVDFISGTGVSQYFTWYYIVAPIIGSLIAVVHFNFILKK